MGAGDTVTARQPGGDERELAVVGVGGGPHLQRRGARPQRAPHPRGPGGERDARRRSAARRWRWRPARTSASSPSCWRRSSKPTRRRSRSRCRTSSSWAGCPAGVAAIVGSIAVLALANALVVAVRRRRRDLAVLRSMGFTRRQTAISVVVMALAIVAIGVLVGLPVGLAVGATLWRVTASGAFVLSDAHFRWELLLLPVVGRRAHRPRRGDRSPLAGPPPRAPPRASGPSRRSGRPWLLVPEPAEEVGAELLLVHVGREARSSRPPAAGRLAGRWSRGTRWCRAPARRSAGWPRCRSGSAC